VSPTTLEQAIQLRHSTLGRLSFFVGLTGLNTMLLLTGWAPAVGGRPVPLELTILGASLLTAVLLGASRLWPGQPTESLPGR